jgi:hypothetical protein
MSFPPKPPVYGKPEKKSYLKILLFLLFVAAAVAAIVWMAVTASPEKKLNCRSDVPSSLGSFGDCTTE